MSDDARNEQFADGAFCRFSEKVQVRKRFKRQSKHFVDASLLCNASKEKSEIASEEWNDLMEFWNRTTISGVAQIGTRSDPRWKLFWFVVSVAGLAMSLYQSRGVITDYFNGRTIQIIDYQNVRKVPFPSFTVCSNVRLHHTKMTFDLQRKLCKGDSHQSCFRTTGSQDPSDNEDEKDSLAALLRHQAKFSPDERAELFYGNQSFLKKCYWKGFECQTSNPDEVMFFSSLLQGPCFTINLGINKQIVGADYREFELVLDMDLLSRRLKFNDVVASYWIHSPGSSPSLFSENVGRVFPGDKVRVEFLVQNITRLQSRNCRSSSDFSSQKLNVFYTDSRPYNYQQSSCIFYKEDQLGLQKGCLHASVPYNDLAAKIDDPNNVLCTSWGVLRISDCPLRTGVHFLFPVVCAEVCWSNCTSLNDKTVDEIRNLCITSCNDINIRFAANTMSLLLENLVEASMMDDSEGDSMSRNLGEELRNESVSILQLTPTNNVVEGITEESKYSVADLLGILGGNIGLWVGVSIISLAELVELVFLLTRMLVVRCKKAKKKKVKPSKTLSKPIYTVRVSSASPAKLHGTP